jgi:DNA-binding NarL/FixJ family response regulator
VIELEQLWPDPDRRDDALLRLLVDVYQAEPSVNLTPHETRIVEAFSHGMTERDAAAVLGLTFDSVHETAKLCRRKMLVKNMTHACCEALRQGLIH